MAIEFNCPACQSRLRVENDLAGQFVRCGGCMIQLRVPGFVNPTPADDPQPQPDRRPEDDFDSRAELDDSIESQRRLRMPPPRSGRGQLFWIAMIFGVLIVGGCSCCIGVYAILPGERWRTHQSVRGGYEVDLPAEPKKNMPIPGLKDGKNLKVEGAILWKRGELYAVMYEDMPELRLARRNKDFVLDAAVKAIETGSDVRQVVQTRRITVSGCPGREVEYIATDGGTYVARLVIADTRFFRLVGGGRFVRPDNPNVRRFLDSFQVTDPKLRLQKPEND